MNYRHAFNDFKFADNELRAYYGGKADKVVRKNVGKYIFEAFPGKVSNVMINSLAVLPGGTDQRAITTTINNGKWDAAFEAVVGDLPPFVVPL
jgi:hypothetical protein